MRRPYRTTHPRVGRPGGPTPDRRHRRYDPQWPTPKRLLILRTIYVHCHALARGEVLLRELTTMTPLKHTPVH